MARGIQHMKKELEKLVAPKIEAYNKPSFAKGDAGTLHGERVDTGGYKFLRIELYGNPKIKTTKGCQLSFDTKAGVISCNSDSKDIESYYSDSLKKGVTPFTIYLDDELKKALKSPVNSVTITFKKQYFGKESHSFEINKKLFQKLLS